MPLKRRGGREVGRADLADSGVESIKRDVTGVVVTRQVGTATTTGVTSATAATLNQTAAGRQFASAATIAVTEGAAGTATLTLSRNGSQVLQETGITASDTFTTQNTFTASSVTWSLQLSVAAGTWTVSPWTQNVDDTRG